MPSRKPPLGRGLESVLPQTPYSEGFVKGNILKMIPLSRIQGNPYQPRGRFEEEALEELAESIRRHGVIQPITVRLQGNGTYQIISGERRVRAARMAGLEEIPAYVRHTDDHSLLELALIENIQRADLNPIEIALAYQRMIEELGIRQEDVARRVGKKRATVTNYLRLLQLSPAVQRAILDGRLSMGHARVLAGLKDHRRQEELMERIIREGLSVRATETMVAQSKASERGKTSSARLPQWEKHLRDRWQNAAVQVRQDRKGRFVVRLVFSDEAAFRRFADANGQSPPD